MHEVDFQRKVVFEFQTLPSLLAQQGHNVYVVDYQDRWQKLHPLDLGTLKTVEMRTQRVYAPITLIQPGVIKIPVISRESAFITHYYAIKRAIEEYKIDVIILYSVPTNGLQTIYLARKYRIPVVFRSIDVLHHLVSNPILSKITYLLEKIVYRNVDLTLAICPELGKYVIDMGALKSKVKLLPLGIDTDIYKPNIDTKELREKWVLVDSNKIIMFVGTLPKFSGLDVYLHQFLEIVKQVPEVKLMIVGDGVHRSELENITKELGLSKSVIFTGLQPYETMPQYINLADICLNSFGATGATVSIFPTKVMQYLACGKPVIAYSLPGLKSMLQGSAQGVVYANSPDEMISKTAFLLKSDAVRQWLGGRAVNYVKTTHSYDKIIQQLEIELNEVVRGKL